jgi:PIN domain nuclease of toxin-antitoxin system
MAAVVVDTHAILWYITQDPRLSQKALDALEATTRAGDPIYVPAICLVELTYLIEKNRSPSAAEDRLRAALDDPERPPRFVPMDRSIVDAVKLVRRAEVPDMPDRIVAATALALQLPLISRDARIRASQVQTIW